MHPCNGKSINMAKSAHRKEANVKERDVLWFLGRHGAPIGNTPEAPGRKLSFEEGVAEALAFSRTNPTVARVLPIFIARNVRHFSDFSRLKDAVIRARQEKTFGFFLDVTFALTGDAIYSRLAAQLEKDNQVEDFFVTMKPGKYRDRLLERNTPHVAKKWFFRINMPIDSFQSIFNKFMSVEPSPINIHEGR